MKMLKERLTGAAVWGFEYFLSYVFEWTNITTQEKGFVIVYYTLLTICIFLVSMKSNFEIIGTLVLRFFVDVAFVYLVTILINVDFYIAFQLITFGFSITVIQKI